MLFLITTLLIPSSASADGKDVKVPTFTEASVHDPSVIKVDDMYYVFGSHLGVAKTKDFMNWTTVAAGVNPNNPLFDNVVEELEEALEWAETDTLWAPDVIELNGKFYMYYNACEGGSPLSAMGVAVADHIEGPYKDKGIFLKSGMWNQASEDGKIYNATIHPNVVDPQAFLDKDGKLWMVYGSYSGGIFILQMDATTGLPLDGQGYGTKLMGGNHSRMEGPYIQYVQETGYYYLYITFGGLGADGGYNMRVVRSKNPDGPYVDAEGNDMTTVRGANGTFFDDKSIEPYGVKLMGNYLFENMTSKSTVSTGIGYVSPGHNSVYYDEATGKQLLLFHSRFPQRGEQHEIRVHQLFMNDDGWPVVAPYRYAGEELAKVSPEGVSGNYKFINHGKEITEKVKKSVVITLLADGTIAGDVNGTWAVEGDNKANLVIDNYAYQGVFLKQWDPISKSEVMTFTAVSEQGMSIWGSQLEELSDEDTVAYVKNTLKLGNTRAVIADVSLPKASTFDTKISWKSSDPSIVSKKGAAKRPYSEQDTTITLTATISKNETTATKSFKLVVLPSEEAEVEGEGNAEVKAVDQTTNLVVWIVLVSLLLVLVAFFAIRRKRNN
ncbi:glycoside hydrolase family 43 protein [Sporosarcina sp. ANT_H38]|nr:glycoside hydrolase family 43 protein [Sporosarcina sp. ANT_H38]